MGFNAISQFDRRGVYSSNRAQDRYPAWQTATVDERYERYSTSDIIANYRTKAATTWPGLRGFLIYALHDQHEWTGLLTVASHKQ
jgi:hypothetical protein